MKGEKLKLERPLVVIDLETTGLDVQKDRIVQICVIKRFPNGKQEVKTRLINPTISIPKEASEIHGITDEKVKNEPKFKDLAASLGSYIDGCDVAGYNSNKFDVPMLLHEFERAGIYGAFENVTLVDVYKLYSKFNPRTLEVAYADYCGKKLDAHNAESDAIATIELLESMVSEHSHEIGDKSLKGLSEFIGEGKNIDILGVIKEGENGEAVFAIGKHKGKRLKDNRSYCEWMLKSNFSQNTKDAIVKVLKQNRDEI